MSHAESEPGTITESSPADPSLLPLPADTELGKSKGFQKWFVVLFFPLFSCFPKDLVVIVEAVLL